MICSCDGVQALLWSLMPTEAQEESPNFVAMSVSNHGT